MKTDRPIWESMSIESVREMNESQLNQFVRGKNADIIWVMMYKAFPTKDIHFTGSSTVNLKERFGFEKKLVGCVELSKDYDTNTILSVKVWEGKSPFHLSKLH